jgi:hypothetical protein
VVYGDAARGSVRERVGTLVGDLRGGFGFWRDGTSSARTVERNWWGRRRLGGAPRAPWSLPVAGLNRHFILDGLWLWTNGHHSHHRDWLSAGKDGSLVGTSSSGIPLIETQIVD